MSPVRKRASTRKAAARRKKSAAKTTGNRGGAKTRSAQPKRKKKAGDGAPSAVVSAPITAPGTPSKYRARVRMYRHGLGDCFLITFPRKGKKPFNMLIDCGVLARDAKFITSIVQHICDTVRDGNGNGKAHLDVVVATHEHKDHLSGFNQARQMFNDQFDFGAVWLGWTENLTKPEIKKIKQARRKAIAKLQLAFASPVLQAAGADVVSDFSSVLAFSSDEDEVGSGKIADALEYLKERGKKAGDLQYLEPGQGPLPLEGVEGVRVYVLGPPRDPILLKGSEVTEKMKDDGVIYHLSRTGDCGADALSAAAGVAADASGSDGDRYHPFAAEHRIMAADGPERNPYLKALQPFLRQTYDDPKQAWRRIDTDWVNAFGQLALDLDNDTNNTSLVLAFEFVKTREVLLFVGDAQVGNWQSWATLEFRVPGRDDPMTAHDLLSRTAFYKVGHHCSHNATLRKGGLELMTRDDLVAFIPLDQATAKKQGTKGWDMPAEPLFRALKKKASNRVVLSDVTENVCKEATKAGVCATGLYIDYFVR